MHLYSNGWSVKIADELTTPFSYDDIQCTPKSEQKAFNSQPIEHKAKRPKTFHPRILFFASHCSICIVWNQRFSSSSSHCGRCILLAETKRRICGLQLPSTYEFQGYGSGSSSQRCFPIDLEYLLALCFLCMREPISKTIYYEWSDKGFLFPSSLSHEVLVPGFCRRVFCPRLQNRVLRC